MTQHSEGFGLDMQKGWNHPQVLNGLALCIYHWAIVASYSKRTAHSNAPILFPSSADPNSRLAPSEPATFQNGPGGYTVTQQRLWDIRRNFLYPFFDRGGSNNNGDLQTDIHASMSQLHKNFNFQLPFFGFRFNYTRVSAQYILLFFYIVPCFGWQYYLYRYCLHLTHTHFHLPQVSMHGFLEFSDPPEQYTYPLTFPIKDWPQRNDPSFIGIFFSKCRIGRIYQTDVDQRAPGVYFR